MLDADKVRNGSKVTPIIWNADFEVSGLSSVPALKPFCDDAVNFMFCQFPIVHYTGDKLIFKKTYLCPIGLLFEKKKTKRIYHVLKDSPAEKVGIGIGDEFVKYVGDIVWNSDTGNTTFDMLIKRKNGKKEIIHFEETVQAVMVYLCTPLMEEADTFKLSMFICRRVNTAVT